MKKRIVVFSLCVSMSFLFCHNVWAKSFTEERNTNYQFDIYVPKSNMHLIKQFTKISDGEGNVLYEVTPKSTYFNGRNDYKEVVSTFDSAILEKFSKILYFGYGYQGNKEDSYYFATQYMLYQVFDDIEVQYLLDGIEKDDLKEEVAEIKKSIENVSFSLKDFTTTKSTYEIKDTYILDNFTVEGENVEVTYEKDKIKLSFLNDQEEYNLVFHPKNLCENINVWSSMSMLLMPRMTVCEKEYTISIKYKNQNQASSKQETDDNHEKEDISKEDDKKNHNEIDSSKENENVNQDQSDKGENDKKEDSITIPLESENELLWDETLEVNVPNTFKKQFPFFMIFLILGAAYNVFKK